MLTSVKMGPLPETMFSLRNIKVSEEIFVDAEQIFVDMEEIIVDIC